MEKLIKIQSELKANKDLFNAFGKYHYRSCESILEALKPLLKENNCLLTLSDKLVCVGQRYYIEATATFNDGKNTIQVTAYAREEETKKGMDGSQVTGASSSYARKYSLNALFLIDDNKDSDSTNTHDDKPKQTSYSNEVQSQKQDTSNEKEWLSEKQCKSAVERITAGDLEVYQKTIETFKIRKEYRAMLDVAFENVKPKN